MSHLTKENSALLGGGGGVRNVWWGMLLQNCQKGRFIKKSVYKLIQLESALPPPSKMACVLYASIIIDFI